MSIICKVGRKLLLVKNPGGRRGGKFLLSRKNILHIPRFAVAPDEREPPLTISICNKDIRCQRFMAGKKYLIVLQELREKR